MPISYTPYTLAFTAESTIYTTEVKCHVNENDFNYTTNPTVILSGSTPGLLNNNVSGSDFAPFATTVGLYNDQNELLVVGKFGTPYPVPRHVDSTFVVKWDS